MRLSKTTTRQSHSAGLRPGFVHWLVASALVLLSAASLQAAPTSEGDACNPFMPKDIECPSPQLCVPTSTSPLEYKCTPSITGYAREESAGDPTRRKRYGTRVGIKVSDAPPPPLGQLKQKWKTYLSALLPREESQIPGLDKLKEFIRQGNSEQLANELTQFLDQILKHKWVRKQEEHEWKKNPPAPGVTAITSNQRWHLLEYALRDAFRDLIYQRNWDPLDATRELLNIAGDVRGKTDVSHHANAFSLMVVMGLTPREQSERAATNFYFGVTTLGATLGVALLAPAGAACAAMGAVGAVAAAGKGLFDVHTNAKTHREAALDVLGQGIVSTIVPGTLPTEVAHAVEAGGAAVAGVSLADEAKCMRVGDKSFTQIFKDKVGELFKSPTKETVFEHVYHVFDMDTPLPKGALNQVTVLHYQP